MPARQSCPRTLRSGALRKPVPSADLHGRVEQGLVRRGRATSCPERGHLATRIQRISSATLMRLRSG